MAKKKNDSAAAAAGSSLSKDIQELKSFNSHLVKEVAEFRKHLEHVRSKLHSLIAERDIPDRIEHHFVGRASSSTLGQTEARSNAQLDSLTADGDILDRMERDIVGQALSSTLGQAEAHTQLDSLTAGPNISHGIERDVVGEAEWDRAEQNAIDPPLIEQDGVRSECLEKAKPEKTKKKNWMFYPIAVTAIFFISTTVVSLCKSTKLKK